MPRFSPQLIATASAALALAGLGSGCSNRGSEATAAAPPKIAAVQPANRGSDPAPARPASTRRAHSSPGTTTLWVVEGKVVRLHSKPRGPVIASVGSDTDFGSPTVFATFAKRGGWAQVSSPETVNEPAWVRFDPKKLVARPVSESIIVDLSRFRATLYDRERIVRRFTVSIGAPGMETPTGRFAVTDSLRGGDLDPVYGCCAIALTARQPNLPSGWAGGDRIAIHGTAEQLGAAVSHGCVRAADADVSALIDRVPLGTPVTIRP